MSSYTKLITVTPAIASHWLAKPTTLQRRVTKSRVEFLADQIRTGRWQTTHQGIALLRDGSVLDGQHRLHAIIAADQPVTCNVTFNADPDWTAALDTGLPRTGRQFLSKGSAAIGTWLFRWVHGITPFEKVNYLDLIHFVEEWPEDDIIHYAHLAKKVYQRTQISESQHGALLAVAAKTVYGDRIDNWVAGLCLDAPLVANDPRAVLMQRWQRQARLFNGSGRQQGILLLIRTWNAYVTGETLAKLYVPSAPLQIMGSDLPKHSA